MNLVRFGRYYINPEAVASITDYPSDHTCVVHLKGLDFGITLPLQDHD